MHRQYTETQQTLFEKCGKERGGNGNIMEGGELVQRILYAYI
jgi:hypothetical protein